VSLLDLYESVLSVGQINGADLAESERSRPVLAVIAVIFWVGTWSGR